jgi:plasmid maintenance system antidote protein VapI
MSGWKYPAIRLIEQFPPDTTASFMADIFGLERATIVRWRNQDCKLTEYMADRYAIMLGKHPFEIWPEWFDDYLEKV